MPEARAKLTSAVTYRDPRAALAWLEKAFGFEVAMLIEDDDGQVAHSEMRHGEALIMIGGEWSDDHRSPAALDQAGSTSHQFLPLGGRFEVFKFADNIFFG